MKNKQNRYAAWVSRFALGLGLSLSAGTVLLLPNGAMAQADPTADQTIWGNQTTVDGDNGAAASLMDVIQRGQVGPTQSRADFLKKQNENLSDAAEAFRARQREAFQTPTTAPSESVEAGNLQSQALDGTPRPALW